MGCTRKYGSLKTARTWRGFWSNSSTSMDVHIVCNFTWLCDWRSHIQPSFFSYKWMALLSPGDGWKNTSTSRYATQDALTRYLRVEVYHRIALPPLIRNILMFFGRSVRTSLLKTFQNQHRREIGAFTVTPRSPMWPRVSPGLLLTFALLDSCAPFNGLGYFSHLQKLDLHILLSDNSLRPSRCCTKKTYGIPLRGLLPNFVSITSSDVPLSHDDIKVILSHMTGVIPQQTLRLKVMQLSSKLIDTLVAKLGT